MQNKLEISCDVYDFYTYPTHNNIKTSTRDIPTQYD